MNDNVNIGRFYEAKFPFIEDNVFLVAIVEKNSGKQKLKIQKFNPKTKRIEFEDGIDCIHTAITTITLDEFTSTHENAENFEIFAKNMINARTTEYLTTVDLSPEERFFAFKSWTHGIAESGLNSLYLQADIESAAHFQYPIVNFLLKSLMKINFDYIGIFLEKIKRDCLYEGFYHKSCLRANLELILKIIIPYLNDPSKYNEILEILMEIAEMDPKYLFRDSDKRIKKFLVETDFFTEFEDFSVFFEDENIDIKIKVAANPSATKFKEYRKLFECKNRHVRQSIASNPNATKFEEYKFLILDPHWDVRYSVAANPNAVKFDEYRNLFDDEEISIRTNIAENPNASKFNEYKKLFNDKLLHIRCSVAKNPNAVRFEEYKSYFYDKDWRIRQKVAENPNAVRFEEFKMLFNDPQSQVRSKVARNPMAITFKDYKKLFEDSNLFVKYAVITNKSAKSLEGYSELIDNIKNKRHNIEIENNIDVFRF